MATTTFQTQQFPYKELTPEQELFKKREAEELFKRLQFLLLESETPGLDILSEALLKVEELSAHSSRQTDIDPDVRKTLEDIAALLLSARQMAKNKGIAERLTKIAEGSQRALRVLKPSLPTGAKTEAAVEFFQFMNTWRPLFYLLVNSREFRVLILDSIRIARRVVYSYTDTISDEPTQQFVEGEPVIEVAQRVKEEVKQKGGPEMSDEEWEKIQDDIQRVLVRLSKEPTYRNGLENLFHLLDMFQRHLLKEKPVTLTGLPTAQEFHIQRVMGETELLISSFSGKEALEQFKFYLGNMVQRTKEDQKFHNYLCELKEFILKAKSDQEIMSKEFKEKSKDLARRGRQLMREFKEDDLKPLLDSANVMVENIKNDDFLQILQHHAGIVQSDLTYVDMQGTLQPDTDMLTKLQKVLLPVLVDALKYIPVPKIVSKDAKREYWLDKIVLCSYDIIPENIRFHLESDSEFSLQDIEVKGTHSFLVIQLNKLRTELKDVEFWFKKKTFPELEDKGRVTFRIKGQGARLTLTYEVDQGPKDKFPRIMKGKAYFDIYDMDIEFDTSTIHHTVLVPMLTNMFKLQIKAKIEEEVEKSLESWVSKLGDLLSSTLVQTNRPFLSGLELAKKAIKSSEVSQLYQKRREKLE